MRIGRLNQLSSCVLKLLRYKTVAPTTPIATVSQFTMGISAIKVIDKPNPKHVAFWQAIVFKDSGKTICTLERWMSRYSIVSIHAPNITQSRGPNTFTPGIMDSKIIIEANFT